MFRRTPDRRRSPLLRLISLASALALVLSGATDAYGLHRCAHHDALPGETTTEAPAHAGHAVAHATHDDGGHESDAHESGCTCVGHCAGAPGIASPVAVGSSELQLDCSIDCSAPVNAEAPRPDHAAHFLPFAQAPPLAR